MKEFIVQTEVSEVKFNFPTNLKELSEKYLKEVTDSITVAPNYSLIGLVYHERIAKVVLTWRNNNKKASFGVFPIFIKSGGGDTSIVDSAKFAQKLLIDNSQITLAHHCAAPANTLNIDYFTKILDLSIDKDLYQKETRNENQSEVLFIEFKIVPNNAIIALYNDATKVESPYVTVTSVNK